MILTIGSDGMYFRRPGGLLQYTPKAPITLDSLRLIVPELNGKGFQIDTVWIARSFLRWKEFPTEIRHDNERLRSEKLGPEPEWFAAPSFAVRPERPWSSWRLLAADAYVLHVSIPSWQPASPWGQIDSAESLILELERFEAAVGPWRFTSGITSDALIRGHARGRGVAIPALGPLPYRLDEAPMQWHRRPPKTARWCVALDATAQHLAAASSLDLPAGNLEFLNPDKRPEKLLPGLYQIPGGDGRSVMGRVDLPPPWFHSQRSEGRGIWVTAPTAQAAGELGVKFSEAWVWDSSHRYLDHWYKTLRHALMVLRPEGGPAYEAVKEVYRSGVGRFSSLQRSYADPERDPLYQPYWRSAIVAEARTRLWRRLYKAPKGFWPVAIDVDSVWYLSNYKDPSLVASKALLPFNDGLLGHMHYKATFPGELAFEALCSENTAGALGVLRQLSRGAEAVAA